jgi:serine/threonine protein phosphatase 1
MTGKVYVMSDLHGNFIIFKRMLEKIQFSKEDTLYILGDCCDRGPESLDIYYYITKEDNIHLVKGNHETMMRDAFIANDNTSKQTRLWNQNGGLKTFHSYHEHLHKEAFKPYDYQVLKAAFYQMMIRYVNRCPNFVEVHINEQDYVLIHAGINPEKGLYEQSEEECVWMREYFYMSKGLDNKIIIFGHTPTCHIHQDYSCFDIWIDPIYQDKIGIDGGVGGYEQGQLNCLCLNTKEVTVLKVKDCEGRAL